HGRGLGFESPVPTIFFNQLPSVMVPNIFTLGIAGLGPLTGKGSGILVMSIVGGTIPPVRVGARANRIGEYITLSCCSRFVICMACATASEAQSPWSHFDAPGSVTENS